MRILIAIFAVLFSVASPLGAATGWTELAPGTSIRLVAAETWSSEGRTMLAIELDMPADTKTYWRVPGETGIPTELDFSGSRGVTAHRFVWPYPQIEQLKGYTDFVYYGPTVIPVEIAVDSERPVVNASLLMGVCSDICVPATAEFSLALDIGPGDIGMSLRIDQAVAAAPIAWTQPTEAIGDVTFDRDAEALRVTVDPLVVDPASVIADAAALGFLLGAPQKSPEPAVILLPLLGGGDGSELSGHKVLLTFMTREGPYELWRQVAP